MCYLNDIVVCGHADSSRKVCTLSMFVVSLDSMIVASLSDPHTSMTALLDACVCLRVAIYRKFKLSERFHICTRAKTNLCLVNYSTPMKVWLRTMTDKGRLLTDSTVKSHTVVALLQARAMHNDTHERQKFSS